MVYSVYPKQNVIRAHHHQQLQEPVQLKTPPFQVQDQQTVQLLTQREDK